MESAELLVSGSVATFEKRGNASYYSLAFFASLATSTRHL